jgi:hypothetical protein
MVTLLDSSNTCSVATSAVAPPIPNNNDIGIASAISNEETVSEASVDAAAINVNNSINNTNDGAPNIQGINPPHSGMISIVENATFPNYGALWTSFNIDRQNQKMKRSMFFRNSSDTIPEDEALKLFGVPQFEPPHDNDGSEKPFKFPRRGHIKCNGKATDEDGRSIQCPYAVPYSYIAKLKAYQIRSGAIRLCLEHNHPPTLEVLDGVDVVKRQIDLKPDEVEAIQTLSLTHQSMSAIKEALALKFPMRDFETQLVQRVADAMRDKTFGKDRHQMGSLMKKGHDTVASGGVWLPIICPNTNRLIGCHYQTKRMKLYAVQCGSYFVTVDGTHGTNMYKLTNVPFVTVCCLGLSHIVGTGIYPSENTLQIVKSAQLFSIASKFADDDPRKETVSIIIYTAYL